jgi:glycosyltransferase involved in cell wall biosynthesis
VKAMYRFALASRRISVIFQNPDDRDYFIDKKITSKNNSYLILGSGVDTDLFSPSSEDPIKHNLTVLFFGRMLWDKGIEYLIDATNILKSEGIEFTLNLAGEPDKSNPSHITLEQLKEWENNGLVNYLGYCSDMVEIIRASDLVVLPTYYREGVPLSLIEAASVGKPIVTTDMPGCREIVVDGVNGFLVPVKDSIALADKIREILLNKDLRVLFGRKSRERAIHLFAKEIVAKRTIEIYLNN